MTGGFLQLVAKNYDDLYLTISPQVTMFKIVYRRYTNFSIYDDDILIKSGGNFSSKTIVKLEKKADLLHKMYIAIEIPQIKISKKKPTFGEMQNLLATYGITWNYSPSYSKYDTVTLDSYHLSAGTYSIATTINKKIYFLANIYNLLNNGIIMANDNSTQSEIGAISTLFLNSLERMQDSNGVLLSISQTTKFNNIKSQLINGRSLSNELLYRMSSMYVPNYGNGSAPILSGKFLSNPLQQTLTYPTTKNLLMYDPTIAKTLLENGLLIGALKSYSKDTQIYNANYSYNNSGFITSGYLPNITASGIGTLYNNVMYKVVITNASILDSNILNGSFSGTFVDNAMSANSLSISGINIINASISTIDDIVYTNYSILNASITLATGNINKNTINGVITSGTLVQRTISGITMSGATITNPAVVGGSVSIPKISSTLQNDGKILLPFATMIDSNNIKTKKTLYNCIFTGNSLNESSITTTRNIISGQEAKIVITNAELTFAVLSPDISSPTAITGGTLKNGLLVENNIDFSNTISNVVLLDVSIKSVRIINKTQIMTVTTLYNMTGVTLTNINILNGKISTATITGGTIVSSVLKNTIINSVSRQTQNLTGGVLSGGTMYNFAIQDIQIPTGILPSTFLTNVTVTDTFGLTHYYVELDNLNLSYPLNITNATIKENLTNSIHIPDLAINSYDNFQSKPLFGNIVKRSGIVTDTTGISTIYINNSPSIIKLQLYNADDFRYIAYMTYLNNIIRIKISLNNETIAFNPTYSIIQKGNLGISDSNLNLLTPQLLSLDESILFYHTIDPDITKYNVYTYDQGDYISSYFDKLINNTYDIVNIYNNVVPVTRDYYKNTDAYIIYTKYIDNILQNDSTNSFVESASQMLSLATYLMTTIDYNIQYNFTQLHQILEVLYNGYRHIGNSYIITFYNTFSYSSSSYTATNTAFTPIIDSKLTNLNDNFLSILNNVVPRQYSGTSVINFFNNYLTDQFSNSFVIECQKFLTNNGYSDYYSQFSLWERNLLKAGGTLQNIYSLVTNNQYLMNSLAYGKMSISAFIPFLAAQDIPQMVYDMFYLYADTIFDSYLFKGTSQNITTSSTEYINFKTNFLEGLYNYTDSENNISQKSVGNDVYAIKKKIYEKIIYSTFLSNTYQSSLSSTTTSTQILNDTYFKTLQSEFAAGKNYLLAVTFRPEQFMCPSSRANGSVLEDLNLAGNIFSAADMEEMVYLPIEWLTQTYYNILGDIIDKYIDENNSIWMNTETINTYYVKQYTRGILANIINCFIATSQLPTFNKYKDNRFSLFGMLNETNSVLDISATNALVGTTIKSPLYCDAISSITYQTQKKFIQLYNRFYNNCALSENYYKTNLGTAMSSLYTYVATQFNSIDSTNVKYDSSTVYTNKTPGTLSFANDFSGYTDGSGYVENLTSYPVEGWVSELYPSIDQSEGDVGFDVYRLSNLYSSDMISKIQTFVSDFTILYNFMLGQYNQKKTILQIKNDTTSLKINGYFNDGTPDYTNTKILQKSEYLYGQSQIMNNYIYSNTYTKYIYPLENSSTKTFLEELALNTMNYWIPEIDLSGNIVNNGLLGPLDTLYGTLDTSGNPLQYDTSGNIDYSSGTLRYPSGNIVFELNKLKTLPINENNDNFINTNYNPFCSYFLHDWYMSLSSSNTQIIDSSGKYIKYQTLKNAVNIFEQFIGTTENKLITSSVLSSNPYVKLLYTSSTGGVFGEPSNISDMLIDNVFKTMLSKITNNTFQENTVISKISSTQSNGGYNETLTALKAVFTNNLASMKNQLENITKFANLSIFTTKYFNNNQYIDTKISNISNDIYYYDIGGKLINTTLENAIMQLIEFTPAKFAWVKELGLKLIKNISIKIGGQIIDSHSSELMHFINKIYRNNNQLRGYDMMIGNIPELYEYTDVQRLHNKLCIPIHFWFNKNAGNVLPLLCLLYSDVELIIEMNNYTDVLVIEKDSFFTKVPKLKMKLFAQYIYLDEDERSRMAKSKLEYLIDSFNYSGLKIYSSKNLISTKDAQIVSRNKNYIKNDVQNGKQLTPVIKYNIYLDDPISYLIWYVKIINKKTQLPLDARDWNKFGFRARDTSGNIADISGNIIENAPIFSSISLQMNGSNREEPKNEYYYTHVSPHSKSVPGIETGEYFYSYSLYPLMLQPSGSANYSELTEASVTMTLTDYMLEILKQNSDIEIHVELWGNAKKILRIFSGFGALAFYK